MAGLREAPEDQAFKEFFAKLSKAITHSEELAPALYSEGLILQQARDEVFLPAVESRKTSVLLAAVEKNLSPERMDVFIRILSGSPPLQDVARQLDQRVAELRLKRREPLSPPASPASPNTSRSAAGRRQNYRKRRSDSFTPLEELFAYLVSDLVDILEGQNVLQKMKTTLDYLPWRTNPKFKNIISDSYRKANTVKEFIDAIHPTCLDCELLAIAVEATKCNEAIDKLDRYLELKDTKSISISEGGAGEGRTIEGVANGNVGYVTAGAVFQREGLTGKQYEHTTNWLSYVWEIPRAAFRFFWSKKGSFILRWKIDTSLETHIRSVPITGRALKKLAELQVSEITLGDSYELEIPNLSQDAEEADYSSEALSSAIWAGNDDMMELLIKGGATPDKQDEEGFSLLMGACHKGRLHIVNALLNNGATVDLKDHDGWSALHAACSRKHTEVVRVLLHMGANPNISSNDGWTALMAACTSETSEIVTELLKAGADPNAANHERWTALMTAARKGRHDSVVKLLEHKANPDLQDDTGWSALMAAVWQSHEETALRMIEAGATPDIQDDDGTNALFLAIYRQQPRVIKALMMAQQLNVNLQDMVGETALMYACKMKDLDSVKMLLERNANPNIVSNSNETALLFATQRKEVRIAEELMKAKADPNYKTQNRVSALMVSSKEGSGQLVECLLQYGADPNQTDETSGYTALMFGAEAGHLDVVMSLLRANAHITLKNKDGASAYYLAYQSKHVEVAQAIHRAHEIQTAALPATPSVHVPSNCSVETQKFIAVLLSRLQRGPLLMDPAFAEAERKRRKWAISRQQTIHDPSSEVAVGAS